MQNTKLKLDEKYGKIFLTLSDEQAGQLITALCVYQFGLDDAEKYISDDIVEIIFSFMKREIDCYNRRSRSHSKSY